MTTNSGNPWCDKQDTALSQRHHEGLSYAEIAERMGRTPYAIECRLKYLGYNLERASTETNTAEEPKMKNRTVTTKTFVGSADASTLSLEQLLEVIEQEEAFIKRLRGISVSEAREKLIKKHADNLVKLEGLLGELVRVVFFTINMNF